MKRIYIAGPYSASTATERRANVYRAFDAMAELIKAGHAAYCPHLTHYFDNWWNCVPDLPDFEPIPYEAYMQQGDAFLQICDGLLFVGWSPGADRERTRAIELGIPVYNSVKGIPA